MRRNERREKAKGFIFNRGEILILERSLTTKHRPGEPDVPGGKLDEGETPKLAFVRETMEETGIEIAENDLLTFSSEGIRHIFAAKLLGERDEYPITLDSSEHVRHYWKTPKAIVDESLLPKRYINTLKANSRLVVSLIIPEPQRIEVTQLEPQFAHLETV